MKTSTKLFTIVSLVVLAALVIAPAALAFDGRSGDRVIIGKDEVINDDLYLAGREVIVEGTVNGDLLVAGETVVINGKVSGDLWAAGNSVTVNGEVGDDLFAAASSVTIGPSARIADDVFASGANLESKDGSLVGGSLLIGAFQALVSGNVAEDLLSGTNRLRLEGTVSGDASIAVDTPENNFTPGPIYFGPNTPAMPSIPAGLSFGEGAQVTGKLEYTSPIAQNIPASVAAQVQYKLPPVDAQVSNEIRPNNGISSRLLDNLRRMIALLLVGLLVARLVPAWILNPAGKLRVRPFPSIGVGLMGIVVIPIALLTSLAVVILVAILMGALTLGELVGAILALGLPVVTLAGILFWLVLGYLPQAIVAYLSGHWILQRTHPASAEKIYWPILLGLVILSIIIALPFVGGLIQFLVILAGLGAIGLLLIERRPQAKFTQA